MEDEPLLRPGARVVGHTAKARLSVDSGRWTVRCTCDGADTEHDSLAGAAASLLRHLRAAVAGGAAVAAGDDGEGAAGVREPRRPTPGAGSGAVALEPEPRTDPAPGGAAPSGVAVLDPHVGGPR